MGAFCDEWEEFLTASHVTSFEWHSLVFIVIVVSSSKCLSKGHVFCLRKLAMIFHAIWVYSHFFTIGELDWYHLHIMFWINIEERNRISSLFIMQDKNLFPFLHKNTCGDFVYSSVFSVSIIYTVFDSLFFHILYTIDFP